MISKGDWYIHPNGTIKRAEYEVEKGSFIDLDCTLWQPKEGEWVIPNTKTTESFNVFRYTENYKGFDLQPFIGELPTFLKDKR